MFILPLRSPLGQSVRSNSKAGVPNSGPPMPPRRRHKTPLEMLAEELSDSKMVVSQTGGLDAGVAGLNEMSAFESIAERRIQEALAKGDFDRLKIHGQPLDLGQRPSLDDSDALAAKVLRNANVLPEWVEGENRMRAQIDAFRLRLRESPGEGLSKLEAEAELINEQIRRYNLRCPPKLQKHFLDVSRERQLATQGSSLAK